MNRKLLPVVAVFLVLLALFGSTPLSYALVPTFGPKLDVWTIPQDDQKREKGIILLGLGTNAEAGVVDLLSQHKILVTWNGLPLVWRIGKTGPSVVCNVLEKDKVNVVDDPKSRIGKQFRMENLMTKLVDVSDKFECKVRWKSPAEGIYESVGVLDVYFTGRLERQWIADNILVVEVFFTVGRTLVFGSDIQDICVLGYPMPPAVVHTVTKPDGDKHYIVENALGSYVSCEDAALLQREALGLKLEQGQDPQDTVPTPQKD